MAAAVFKTLAQTVTAVAAAAFKTPAQTVIAAAFKASTPAVMAPKALEKMASITLKQTVFKAKEEDSNDNSYIDRLKTNIKVLQRTNNILLGKLTN